MALLFCNMYTILLKLWTLRIDEKQVEKLNNSLGKTQSIDLWTTNPLQPSKFLTKTYECMIDTITYTLHIHTFTYQKTRSEYLIFLGNFNLHNRRENI